ncbi:hypothetical protein [Dactylosporangium salmoneum]|uniref:Uncharacterized protein n=1 Tax=Dactylosporangium salmoneum TaxID=53361 RepID=A0ABP5T814_9ACTN
MSAEVIDHATAVDRIADCYADRTAFIVLAGLNLDLHVARRLDPFAAWTAYVINTSGMVLVTGDLQLLIAQSTLADIVGAQSITMFTVPKTVPARKLSKALGQEIPTDGSRDILICSAPGEPIVWPMVFVEVLRRVDPKAAASLEANDLARLS